EHRLRLAGVRLNQGVLHSRQSSLKEAAGSFAESAALLEKLDRKQRAVAEVQAQLARNYVALAHARSQTGRPVEGAEAFREACRLYQALADADPKKPEYLANRADILDEIGNMWFIRKQPARALAAYRDSQKAWQQLADRDGASDHYKSQLASATGNA